MNFSKSTGINSKYVLMFLFAIFSGIFLWSPDTFFYPRVLGTVIFHLIVGILLFSVPGFFLCRNILYEDCAEQFLVGSYLGTWVVSTIVFGFCAFLNVKISASIIVLISIIVSSGAYMVLPEFSQLSCAGSIMNRAKKEYILVFLLCIIVFAGYMRAYEPAEEFIPSVEEWTGHRFTSCWINASMEMLDYAKYLKTYTYEPFTTIFHFPPNITFGNVALSAPFIELFQLSAWRYIYVFHGVFTAVFLYLILRKLKILSWIAFFISGFAALNPFFLNMCTADRNALAVSSVLFLVYLLLHAPDSCRIAGFIAGITTASGLRHIPVISVAVLSVFFLNHYIYQRNYRKVMIFLGVACVPLLPVVTHFLISGNQGALFLEKHSFFGLYEFEYRGILNFPFISEFTRVPFYPFPNYIYNLLVFLRLFGYLFMSFVIFGIPFIVKQNKKIAFFSFSTVFIYWLMLGMQADWLNKEKLYPSAMMFPGMLLCSAFGLNSFAKNFSIKKSAGFMCILTLLYSGVCFLEKKEFPADIRIYHHYDLKAESFQEYRDSRKLFCNIPLFPDYSRFFFEQEIRASFFNELPYYRIKSYKKNRDRLLIQNRSRNLLQYMSRQYREKTGSKKNIFLSAENEITSRNIDKSVFYSDYHENEPGFRFLPGNASLILYLNENTELTLKRFKYFGTNLVNLSEIPDFNSTNPGLKKADNTKGVVFPQNEQSAFGIAKYIRFRTRDSLKTRYTIREEYWIFEMKETLKHTVYMNDFVVQRRFGE